jgi:hypothetical protein
VSNLLRIFSPGTPDAFSKLESIFNVTDIGPSGPILDGEDIKATFFIVEVLLEKVPLSSLSYLFAFSECHSIFRLPQRPRSTRFHFNKNKNAPISSNHIDFRTIIPEVRVDNLIPFARQVFESLLFSPSAEKLVGFHFSAL